MFIFLQTHVNLQLITILMGGKKRASNTDSSFSYLLKIFKDFYFQTNILTALHESHRRVEKNFRNHCGPDVQKMYSSK